jgi:tetratricopeptide (TPR) repeat protein
MLYVLDSVKNIIFAQIFKMAKNRRKNKNEDELLVDVTQVADQAQTFIERNQTMIIAVVAGLLIIVGGLLAYKMVYQAPLEKTATDQMFKAEYQFQRDSFALALESPGGGYDGLLDIIDNYGGTKASNLAKYYAGISYLNLNRFEDAISYLKSHSSTGRVTSITKYGALGDAHSELQNFSSALSSYKKATQNTPNALLTPYYLNKLGLLYRHQGDTASATAAFKRIKKEFPQSAEAQDIDKYLVAN